MPTTNIAKQIIDQRVIVINRDYCFFPNDDEEKQISKTFLLLAVSSYLDIDYSEAISYITDGPNDGGIDAAYIDTPQDGQVNVILFQSKYKRDLSGEYQFPANDVEKAVNTVSTIFDPDNKTKLNDSSQRVVDEIRSLILDGYIPYVTFVLVNNGLKWNADAQQFIENAFGKQEQVTFEHYGYSEILGYIERVKPINTQLQLSDSAIQEDFNYKRAIIGKINVSEIRNLMNDFGDNLLERNIRKYLGRNTINEEIAGSLTGDNPSNFFFYNNGITMICSKFSYNALQKANWIVKVEGLQIINGGQTCRTIMQTLNDNPDLQLDDVYVLIRVYELNEDEDEDIVNTITFATNHQNPVDLRDLKANSNQQKALVTSAKDLGYVYKSKRDNAVSGVSVIPSTVAAEAVFAIWRKAPHLSKYKKSELFGLYYDQIFDDLNASQMIIAVVIFRYCDANRKRPTEDVELSSIRSYSNYFLSCMIGHRVLKNNSIGLSQLTHQNFEEILGYFNSNKETLIQQAEKELIDMVRSYFRLGPDDSLSEIDGRTMAAVFRRFDLVEQFFRNVN